jgi:Rubisco LSMT substrate-binding
LYDDGRLVTAGSLQVQDDDPLKKMKSEVLDDFSLPDAQTFPLRRDGWPTTMLPYVAFVQLTPENCAVGSSGRYFSCGKELRKLAKSFFNERQLPVTANVDTGAIARAWLSVELAQRVAALERTRGSDEALAASLTPGAGSMAASSTADNAVSYGVTVANVADGDEYLDAAIASVRVEEGRILRMTRRKLLRGS